MTPEQLYLRATLATMKQTEAGRTNPALDYNSWYGTGSKFTDKKYSEDPIAYANHPGDDSKKEGINTAAGAFQFLEGSYYGVNSLVKDFGPQSQEQAAVNLMTSKGYEAAISGDILDYKITMSGRWISLKHWNDESLAKEFKKNIANELNNTFKIVTPIGTLLKRQTNIEAKVNKK